MVREFIYCSKLHPGIPRQIKKAKSGKSYCSLCSATATKTWRHTNPKKYEARLVRWKDKYFRTKGISASRVSSLRKRYNLTPEQYDDLWIEQLGQCAICRNVETVIDSRTKYFRELSVDHCHKTNKIRGLLCRACNIGLGYFKDSLQNISNAFYYLEQEA